MLFSVYTLDDLTGLLKSDDLEFVITNVSGAHARRGQH